MANLDPTNIYQVLIAMLRCQWNIWHWVMRHTLWQIMPVLCLDVWYSTSCTEISSRRVPSTLWKSCHSLATSILSWSDPHDVIFSWNAFSSYPRSSFHLHLAVKLQAPWLYLLFIPTNVLSECIIIEALVYICVTETHKGTTEFARNCYGHCKWSLVFTKQTFAVSNSRQKLSQNT